MTRASAAHRFRVNHELEFTETRVARGAMAARLTYKTDLMYIYVAAYEPQPCPGLTKCRTGIMSLHPKSDTAFLFLAMS